MAENLIERYLTDIGEIRGTRSNVPETSFYPSMRDTPSNIFTNRSCRLSIPRCARNSASGTPPKKSFAIRSSAWTPFSVPNSVSPTAWPTPRSSFSIPVAAPAPTCAPCCAYLATLGLPDPDADQETAELIWYHALAIGFSPAYLAENADGVRQDWPRIPLPGWGGIGTAGRIGSPQRAARDRLSASAALGRQVAALLDTETAVSGVTVGKIRDDLKGVAVFRRLDGKPANPESGDLDLTAGWGHAGKGGVTMPGRGKIEETLNAQHSTFNAQGQNLNGESCALNVKRSFDIYLNDAACWRSVPEAVWNYTIGGYQVIKKWLSYREKPLLGRGLTPDEVRYVTEMVRRLAALIALQSALDENYRKAAPDQGSAE